MQRFDTRPASNPAEHWSDALRLSKTFNEHPITFKRALVFYFIKLYVSNQLFFVYLATEEKESKNLWRKKIQLKRIEILFENLLNF